MSRCWAWVFWAAAFGCSAGSDGASGDTSRVGSTGTAKPTDTSSTPTTGTGTPTAFGWVFSQVNEDWITDLLGEQHHAALSHHAGLSRTLVVWDAEAGPHTVAGRVYDATHQPLGDPVDVVTGTPSPSRPDPVATASGWLVTYGATRDVWAVAVADDGTAGTPVQINEIAGVEPDKGQPDAATLSDGTVAVTYHQVDPFAVPVSQYLVRRLDADAQPIGGSVEVATSEEVGSPPDIVAMPGGGYAVTWTSRTPTGDSIWVSWFDGSDTLIQQIQADEGVVYAGTGPSRPVMAADPTGALVVSWRDQTVKGLGAGSYARVYDFLGVAAGPPILLDAQGNRTSTAAITGMAVVAWESPGAPNNLVRLIDLSTGEALSLDVATNPLAGVQQRPAVALVDEGPGQVSLLTLSESLAAVNRRSAFAVWTGEEIGR